MRFPPGLVAFNHRDFRLFWSGQLVSLVGSWMQTVGQSWLIVQLTDSAFKLGLISALQFTPVLLGSLVAGAIADRLPKRRLIIATQTALMLLAFTLSALVYSGWIRYWHVAVLATLLGIVNTLDMPARQSFIVEMVGKRDLLNAIALNSAVFNVARILGPAAAGLLIAKYGVALAFFLNGLSFVAVIIALFAIQSEGLPSQQRSSGLLQQIKEGLRYAVQTPVIFLLMSMMFGVSLFLINWNVLVPLFARQVLGMEAQGFGLLMSSLGVGALTAALILAVVARRGWPLAGAMTAALALSFTNLGMGVIKSFPAAVGLLYLSGLCQILFTAGGQTLVQSTVPDALRGRIMSLWAMVFAGVAPLGALLSGSVTEGWGTHVGFLVNGGLGLVTVLALTAWWKLHHRQPVVQG